jgi:cell division transport system permease protein
MGLFLKRRIAKTHLMPPDSAGGATLNTIVAVMSFLACLTLGAVLTVSHLASQWTRGLEGAMTVQLMPDATIAPEDQSAFALKIVQDFPGVETAKALSKSQAARLLEPWLGEGNVLEDLPVPQLIEVQAASGQRIDAVALREALKTVPGAQLDDHKRWNEELSSFARSSAGTGWMILILIAVATLSIVAFATQAGLEAHRDIVEIVHMIGARDAFIAREFEQHFFWLGLRGGLVGLGLAVVTMIAAGWAWDGSVNAGNALYIPQILSAPLRYIWLLLVPITIAAIALYTARLTVLRVVGKLP